jgi:hypothetical protein
VRPMAGRVDRHVLYDHLTVGSSKDFLIVLRHPFSLSRFA